MAADEPELIEIAGPEPGEIAESGSAEKTEPRKDKDGWDKLQALSPLITGIVLAVVGYFLTGSVNEAIQKSQLQFSYVKEMQDLLAKLGDPKTGPEEAKTIAVALAAFGSFSIPPLLNEIESAETNRQTAGEYGLRTVALADPENACPSLARVLQNRTAAYNWFTHRAAIRILGSANCQSVRPVLTRYQTELNTASTPDGFKAFQTALADEPPVTRETLDQLKSELNKTLTLLEQGSQQ